MNKLLTLNSYSNLFKKVHKSKPYPYQLEAVDLVFNNDITTHVWSRRIGKTLTFSTLGVLYSLIPNSDILLLAPTLRLSEIAFKYIYKALTILGLNLVKANFKDRYIELDNGTSILCGSLKSIDQILGKSYNLILLDEFAVWNKCSELIKETPPIYAGEEPLYQDIQPTLLERNGKLVIFSTYRGKKNLFYKLQSEYPSTINTIYAQNHISKEDIDKLEQSYIKAGMGHIFQQEFLCIPVEGAYSASIFQFLPKDATVINDVCIVGDKSIPLSHFDFFVSGDVGFVHPFALSLIGVCIEGYTGDCEYKGDPIFVVVDTWKKSKATLEEVSKVVKDWESKYTILEYYMDYANQNVINELAINYDISFRNAVKQVDAGLAFIQNISDYLYFNINSKNKETLVMEWKNYRQKNGRIVKKDDDIIDSVRYGLYSSYLDFYSDFFTELIEAA